jgi:hypothetical protein
MAEEPPKTDEQRFEAYLNDEMSDEEAAQFEEELANDPELADRFEQYSRPDAEIEAVSDVEPPDLRDKVRRRIRHRSDGKFFGESGLTALMGSAALIAVLLGLVLFLLLGPFGLLNEEQLEQPQDSAATESSNEDESAVQPDGESQSTADDQDTQSRRRTERPDPAEEFEKSMQEVRRGGGLATPGRVSGEGQGATGAMFVQAYRVLISKPREAVGSELRLMLPDDDVIETEQGFEFTVVRGDAPNLLQRLDEFGAEFEDFRREVPHTERNLAFFKVVLQ